MEAEGLPSKSKCYMNPCSKPASADRTEKLSAAMGEVAQSLMQKLAP